ncbi:MAG TPA: dTMP kinase, partial [Miltoncostaeaceae bacterium]|nr:dTMP kinase [Miltoncostaeaceae bacterium]
MGPRGGLADRGGHRRRRHRDRPEGQPLVAARFIALEGIDGSGKSTQAARLADALRARGHDVLLTREPGGTPVGERLREVVLSSGGNVAPAAEALIFAAARAQLVAEVIRPALGDGRWVVADRFVDSSLAYQGAARGLGIDAVWELNRIAVEGCLPDLAVVLDVPGPLAAGRRGPADRIEAEGLALQDAVAAGYRELARRFPSRVALVPADGSVEEV